MAEAIVGDSAQSARAAVAQAAVAHAAVAQHRLSLKAGRFDLGIWLINRYITRVMAAATRLLLTWFALWVLTGAHTDYRMCAGPAIAAVSARPHRPWQGHSRAMGRASAMASSRDRSSLHAIAARSRHPFKQNRHHPLGRRVRHERASVVLCHRARHHARTCRT